MSTKLSPVRSIWESTGNAPPALPSLQGDSAHDVAIIGAGFTGLSAAHHLHKADVDCVVLEANDAGWGASGRNGGMAVARFKKPFSTLAGKYGNETARRLHGMIHEALDTLEATVREHGIDCDFKRCGHLTPAHGEIAMETLEADIRWLEKEAGDKVPRLLDRAAERARARSRPRNSARSSRSLTHLSRPISPTGAANRSAAWLLCAPPLR